MGILLFVLLFLFLSLQIFVKDISTTVKIETSNLVYRFTMTSCILGLKMGLLLFVLPYVCFSFSPDFSSKISPQPFKIETSNFVYRFTTTSCIVGLKNGPSIYSSLYFFLFLSLQIFSSKISPQLCKTETSNLVY